MLNVDGAVVDVVSGKFCAGSELVPLSTGKLSSSGNSLGAPCDVVTDFVSDSIVSDEGKTGGDLGGLLYTGGNSGVSFFTLLRGKVIVLVF